MLTKVLACGFNGSHRFMKEDPNEDVSHGNFSSLIAPFWDSLVEHWVPEPVSICSSWEDLFLRNTDTGESLSFGRAEYTHISPRGPLAVAGTNTYFVTDGGNAAVYSPGSQNCVTEFKNGSGQWKNLKVIATPITFGIPDSLKSFRFFGLDVVFDILCSAGQMTSVPVLLGESVLDICAGREHILLLSASGSVYSCGMSSRGQLGHGSLNNEPHPRKIEEDFEGFKVIQIAAGGWMSMALNENGEVFVWGWNSAGALGLPSRSVRERSGKLLSSSDEFVEIAAEPVCLPLDQRAVWINCGMRHCGLITSDGAVYVWGLNQHGQLGLGDTCDRDVPTRMPVPGPYAEVCRIFCGEWNTVLLLRESYPWKSSPKETKEISS